VFYGVQRYGKYDGIDDVHDAHKEEPPSGGDNTHDVRKRNNAPGG
jgi:hypothetical protein